MERAVVLSGERQVEPARLPLHVQGSPALGINVADGFVASHNRLVREFERQIAKLLEESRSNVSVAAKEAGSPAGTSTDVLQGTSSMPVSFVRVGL
jgi:DNA-binding NtrC family response regulator